MSNQNKNRFVNKGLNLNTFKYEVIGNFKSSNIMQVQCSYLFKDKNMYLFIDYPNGLCANNAEYIEKAKEYVHIIEKNGELYEYTDEYLKGNSMKLQTPFNYGQDYLEKIELYNKQRAIEEKKKQLELKKAQALEAKKEKAAKAKEHDLAKLEAEKLAREKEVAERSKSYELAKARLAEEERKASELLSNRNKNRAKNARLAEKAKKLKAKEEARKARILEKQKAIKAKEDAKKAKLIAKEKALKAKQDAKKAKLLEKERALKAKQDARQAEIADKNRLLKSKEDAKQAKLASKANKNGNGGGDGKSHNGLKIALVCTSIIAVAGIATSTYLYLTRGQGGDTPTPTPVSDDVVVSFDLNGAITKSGSKTFARVKKNTKFSEVSKPDIIAPAGKTFANEWKIKDGEKISPDYTLTADTSIEPIFVDNEYKVLVDIGDGKWKDETGITGQRDAGSFKYGKTWGEVLSSTSWLKSENIAAPDNYKFNYFGYKSGNDYLPLGNDYLITNKTEVKVCYTPLAAVTVNFDLQGGTSVGSTLAFTVPHGTKFSELTQPTNPTKTGYTFKQWEVTDGTEIPSDYTFNANTTIKAAYTINTHTVKVDINGGTWKDTSSQDERTVGTFNYGTTWSTIVNTEGVKDWLKSDNITAPTDKQFSYFGYSKDSGTTYLPIYDDYVITADTTIKVIYTAKDTVTLFLDPNGGSFVTGGSTELKIVENVQTSTTWGSIKSNYTLVKDAYDYKGYKVGDTKVEDTDTFSTSTYLKGYFEIAASVNWATDSLVSIDAYATQGVVKSETNETLYGLPALKYVYNETSFIGKTKSVKIDDTTYSVVVIGEEEDYTDTGKTKKATLTFQFSTIINNYDLTYSTKAANSNAYETSNLRNQLNNSLASKIKTTTGTSLINSIKPVYKTTAVGGVAEKTDLADTEETIFLPSAKELGFTTVPYELEGTAVAALNEGNTYSYYNDSSTVVTRRSKSTDYLLRSPDFLTAYFAWSVNTEGSLGIKNGDVYDSLDVTSACSIAPCFCIGERTIS